jgi:8-oxo-dGTP diphosphatase
MAHIHEKIDFTTSVFVVHEGKVLLHKHKSLGLWLQPGGHIELNEDPTQAALREVREESGLIVELIGSSPSSMFKDGSKGLIVPMYLNRHHITDAHEHIDFVYFGRIIGNEVRPEEEGGEIRWFTSEDLDSAEFNLLDAVRSYAHAAIEYFTTHA